MRIPGLTLISPLVALMLLAQPAPLSADRPGWNEPGRDPGYVGDGLLRINADYFTLSAATGGDFYFWAPGEFAASAGLLNVPLSAEPIALAYQSDGGDFSEALDVPVDGTISRLSVFAGAQRLDGVSLFRPDGRSIDENPAGVAVQAFRHMQIIEVVAPEPGLWQLAMKGAGSSEMAARFLSGRDRLRERGLRAIDRLGFDFVELRGRPGHQGFFPMTEPPDAGTAQHCAITLSGDVEPSHIKLVGADGDVLDRVDLARGPGAAADMFFADCRVPNQPFRVQVRGVDTEGHPFQRITPNLIAPAGH